MKEKRWFPILYMFAVTAFFSTIVIAFAQVTRQTVRANEALAIEKCVLAVFPELPTEGATAPELHRRFVENVTQPTPVSGGAYTLRKGAVTSAYAVPLSGKGFWAPIKGVIGVRADRQTITGICFYEQNETPGLGAQITTLEFTSQFKGKLISDTGKPINIKRPAAELGKSDVHAVTGATQTSTRLEKIINDGLTKWLQTMSETAEAGGMRQ